MRVAYLLWARASEHNTVSIRHQLRSPRCQLAARRGSGHASVGATVRVDCTGCGVRCVGHIGKFRQSLCLLAQRWCEIMLGGTELAALGPRLRLPFESTKKSPIGLEEKTVMSEHNACMHLSSVCNLSGGGPHPRAHQNHWHGETASTPRARRMPNRECAVPRPELPTGHVSLMPLYLSISPPCLSISLYPRPSCPTPSEVACGAF